jgi:hypothetical protein
MKHTTISPTEAADRLPFENSSRRTHIAPIAAMRKGQMSLFTTDTHFVVYMNAKDPTPLMDLRSREAEASGV